MIYISAFITLPQSGTNSLMTKTDPKSGADDSLIKSIDIPASFGVHGPGEIIIFLDSNLILLLRHFIVQITCMSFSAPNIVN